MTVLGDRGQGAGLPGLPVCRFPPSEGEVRSPGCGRLPHPTRPAKPVFLPPRERVPAAAPIAGCHRAAGSRTGWALLVLLSAP